MTPSYRQTTFYHRTGTGASSRVAARMADALRATGSGFIKTLRQAAKPTADRLLHVLLKSRWGYRRVTHSTLAHACRRYREPFTRVEDLSEREPPPAGGRPSR